MSKPRVPVVSPEQYLEFERSAETRHEYIDGEIVDMAGGSPRHALLAANGMIAIGGQLRPSATLLHPTCAYASPGGS